MTWFMTLFIVYFAKMRIRAFSLIILSVTGIVFSPQLFAQERDAVLQWQHMVPLSTPISGVVVKVNVKPGSHVEKGQALLQLDERARKEKVVALEADLKRAENNRDEARRELARTQDLYDRTLIAKHELQLAKIQSDDGQAQYEIAKSKLVKARMDLEYSTVRAPFNGWVVQRNVEVGQTVVSELQAAPLIVMVEEGRMLARFQVSSAELAKMNIGRKASVKVGNINYNGTIYQASLVPVTGTTDKYYVDVAIDVGDKLYRAGQAAKVAFES
jgi:RND family efflux transporter MFP subunit